MEGFDFLLIVLKTLLLLSLGNLWEKNTMVTHMEYDILMLLKKRGPYTMQ